MKTIFTFIFKPVQVKELASMSNSNSHSRGFVYAVALAAAACAAGCSDEDTPPNADSGGTGGTAGASSGGSGGKASGGSSTGGTAGKGSGGSAGKGGTTGTGGSSAGEGGSGVGGDAGAGVGGDPGTGGEAGAGGAGPEPFAPITKGVSLLIPEVNELRGLTFSADGTKIYASGHVNGSDRQLALVRLNLDGSLDDSFDGDGVLTTNVAVADAGNGHPGDEQSFGMVELENGDLVIQANVSDGKGGGQMIDDVFVDDATLQDPASDDVPRPDGVDVVLLRFTSSGAPVTSFGDNGVARIDFGWTDADNASWPLPTYDSSLTGNARFSPSSFPSDQAWGLAVDDTGAETQLVVFGFGPSRKVASGTQRTDNDRYVAKVLADTGAADPDFAGGKPYTFFMPGTFADNGRRGFVEADGSIVAGGYTDLGAGFGAHIVIERLHANGTPDSTFGFGAGPIGAAVANPFKNDGGGGECYSITRQSNGRYVTAGYGSVTGAGIASSYGFTTSTGLDAVFFGVGRNGLDPSFGVDGAMAIQSEDLALASSEDRARDILALPDDRIIAAGRFGISPAIFVLSPDGDLAIDQGTSGRFEYAPLVDPNNAATVTSHFFKLALSPDGTKIAATTNNHVSGVLLALLNVGTP